ncbi:hypothetical protein JCGZ_01409 [Jatropha curcas]|uniref:Uncharacterized protein n=1 Tax=Jatropha curcas TaxID=180498 RepID=A0A067LKP3_JATCU|nr:hypothetical protein JCGZ_01409 [Jatropha curcas]
MKQRLEAGGPAAVRSKENRGREELRRDGKEKAAQRTPSNSSLGTGKEKKQEKGGDEVVGDGPVAAPSQKKRRGKKRKERKKERKEEKKSRNSLI